MTVRNCGEESKFFRTTRRPERYDGEKNKLRGVRRVLDYSSRPRRTDISVHSTGGIRIRVYFDKTCTLRDERNSLFVSQSNDSVKERLLD